jgi:hypothetical protein
MGQSFPMSVGQPSGFVPGSSASGSYGQQYGAVPLVNYNQQPSVAPLANYNQQYGAAPSVNYNQQSGVTPIVNYNQQPGILLPSQPQQSGVFIPPQSQQEGISANRLFGTSPYEDTDVNAPSFLSTKTDKPLAQSTEKESVQSTASTQDAEK